MCWAGEERGSWAEVRLYMKCVNLMPMLHMGVLTNRRASSTWHMRTLCTSSMAVLALPCRYASPQWHIPLPQALERGAGTQLGQVSAGEAHRRGAGVSWHACMRLHGLGVAQGWGHGAVEVEAAAGMSGQAQGGAEHPSRQLLQRSHVQMVVHRIGMATALIKSMYVMSHALLGHPLSLQEGSVPG